MIAKEKAGPRCWHTGTAGDGDFGRATAFQGNFITPQPRKQGLIESLLLQGEENAAPVQRACPADRV